MGWRERLKHISLIVSTKTRIWGDNLENPKFIVLHAELRSQQGACMFFVIDDQS